jgi:hypothetical protein
LQEVAALLDRGVYDNDVLLAEGWVSGLKYEDEITDDLKKRTGGKVRRGGVCPVSWDFYNVWIGREGRRCQRVKRQAGA